MGGKSEADPKQPPPGQKKVTIDIPTTLQAVYANVALISHTPAEIVFDFGQVMPRMPRGKVLSRVIMSPMHAKMLHMALGQQLAAYEKQMGKIPLPSSLSLPQQFFRFPPQEGENGGKSDNDPS
ncbi:MAG: DUF3467 domain-containing protein [Chloroflexi bacterium]|nr:MAG: DUF3467 domain-containing protein [Chloroflexota bacterium]